MKKTLRIVNAKRQELAQVRWSEPADVTFNTDDAELGVMLARLLANGRLNGIPLRGGSACQIDGQTSYVDTIEQVRPDDVRFLEALSDLISGLRLRGTRLFGLVKREVG